MKEQLITFDTAKLSKEKGFNEVVSFGYTHKEELEKPYYGNRFSNLDLSNSVAYASPTQSLLQKWLREKHKIDLYIDCIGNGMYFYCIYLNDEVDSHIVQDDEGDYEDVLEKGLQQALKLIK